MGATLDYLWRWTGELCKSCRVMLTVVTIHQIVLGTVYADCNAPPATGAKTNATNDRFADGTTVEYFCGTGYDIIGRPVHRTCLGEDKWTDGPNEYSCQIKLTSIATACAVSIVIIVLFILLLIFALRRLRKHKKDLDEEEEVEDPEIGRDNPYFIENGATEEDVNLDLFEMEQNGTVVHASTLPRSTTDLPEVPPNDTRYSTFPKASGDATSNKEKNHIYDSIKHFPRALGESMQINDEPFTRV